MLSASGVTVRYGDVIAVRGAALSAAPGQMVAVTGASGAGKTTLLSVLAGVLAADEGAVLLDGEPVWGRDDAIARGIVLVPQGNALARVLTARENVAAPLLAWSTADAGELAERSLDAVGLGDHLHQLAEQLSGGQQQRVAVARGLATPGDVLIADEPTSELDTTNRDLVMRLLRRRAETGTAVVVATHDPEAAAVCDDELRLPV